MLVQVRDLLAKQRGGEVGTRSARLLSTFVAGATNLTVPVHHTSITHRQTFFPVFLRALVLDSSSCCPTLRLAQHRHLVSFHSPVLFGQHLVQRIASSQLNRERTKMEAGHPISSRSMPSISTQPLDRDSIPRPPSASLGRKPSIRAVPYDPTDTRLPLAQSLSGFSTGSYSPSGWPFPKSHKRQTSKSKLP